MHYYKRNLGDYAKKAGRLSMLQHGAFTLLIDSCYDREQFPTLEDALDWTWASSAAEVEAVEFVLRKFFTLEDGRYVQKRIQEEIAEYHAKATTNARIAQEREAKRKDSLTNRARTVSDALPEQHESPPNHKPLTINQEPITNNQIEVPSGTSLATKRRKQLPVDFFPNEAGIQFATERGLNVADELQKFSDFHTAKGNLMLDWQAAWRTWASNAKTFARSSPSANKQVAIEQRNKSVLGDWLAMEVVNA